MTRRRTLMPTVAASLALIAGAARAEAPMSLRDAVFRAPPVSVRAMALTSAAEAPALPAGIARTSIDHRFDGKSLDGSLGFLCGIHPKAVTDGVAGAYGVDPQGRFLGLKLHMTFR